MYVYSLDCIDFKQVKISHNMEQGVEIIQSIVKFLPINIF